MFFYASYYSYSYKQPIVTEFCFSIVSPIINLLEPKKNFFFE